MGDERERAPDSSGVALGDLLNLPQDRRLRSVLLHQPPEPLLGEVGSDAGVTRMLLKRGQHVFRQLKDLEDPGHPGVILSGGLGKGTDASGTLFLHHPAVPFGALPSRLLVHTVLVGPPGAGLGWPAAAQPERKLTADECQAASPVDREVVVYHEDIERALSGLLHVRVPDQRVLLEAGSGKGPLLLPSCEPCHKDNSHEGFFHGEKVELASSDMLD